MGVTPNAVKFRRAPTKCARYPLSNICAAGKVDQSSQKSQMTCYAPMPLIVPNLIALGQTMCDKSVTIFSPFSILAPQGDAPGPKFTILGRYVQQDPLCQFAKFLFVLATRLRDLPPNFVNFVDGVTDKKTVNDASPHTMRRQRINTCVEFNSHINRELFCLDF